jgi:pantoate--beta-alanine ligase
MRIVSDIASLAALPDAHLVPTMGALHAGHAALIGAARADAGEGAPVVVSVFVNPAQFNEKADFDAYPRTLEADAAFCARLGVDAIFAPSVEAMYPAGELERGVELPPVGTEPGLEDAFRPGHFEGVYRVCRRLFEVTGARRAYFGEKDWQQLQLVRAMVEREGLATAIVGVPTVREGDGLALSSRNVHLRGEDRVRARALSGALVEAGRYGDPAEAEGAGLRVLHAAGIEPEYLAVRDSATLGPVRAGDDARVLVAAKVGVTRLIDNAVWPGVGSSGPRPD